MNKQIKQILKSVIALSLGATILFGCSKDDPPLPQLLTGFTSTTLGLSLNESQGTATIQLSRTANSATTITLRIEEAAETVYGTDYSTEPAATNGEITLEIPAGSNSANLVINKLKNIEFGEVKSFNVTIETISDGGLPGNNNTLEVTFEENPTSSGAVLTPEVGGPTQPNQVFIDLSKQSYIVVDKGKWDLAFHNGNDFRALLNYATYAMARVTDKTDLAEVTDALVTKAYKNEMVTGQANTEYMDDPAGDLSETAIAEISSDDANNMVYVVNRGQLDTDPATERGFVKIRVTRNGNDYVITYGDINDADNFTSVAISKTSGTDLTYFSFDTGVVDVAPAEENWDFMMTTFLNETDASGEFWSYKFKDFALTNSSNIKIAKVDVTGSLTYDSFSTGDLAGTVLENDRLGIGSSWRKFDFATFTYTINAAIFYIIEDTDGNNYKLKFTKMLNDQGDRGYPEFVYELL